MCCVCMNIIFFIFSIFLNFKVEKKNVVFDVTWKEVISVTKISTAHARKIIMSSFIDQNSFIDLD